MLAIQWVGDTTVTELALLGMAFVLSATIGLERQRKLKSAGLRTHTLVGLGSTLFTLVSAYGFSTVAGPTAMVDPSRIAAQVVSGIGFLGAGVIFVRQNTVSGLTTAASIWLTAAVGMACGAGAPLLGAIATGLYLLAMWALGAVGRKFSARSRDSMVVVRYHEGNGALRTTLGLAAERGFEALVMETRNITKPGKAPRYQAMVRLRSAGQAEAAPLLDAVANVPGVVSAKFAPADSD